jgi:fumarate hydratase class I
MAVVRQLTELIRKTTSSLPEDVVFALQKAKRKEAKGSGARVVLETILENCALAEKNSTPLCQDTGTLTFFVDERLHGKVTKERVVKAVAEATEKGYLRRNSIDSVTGKSYDDNSGPGSVIVHYKNGLKGVTLVMKGGGSENMSRQYSLPDSSIGAGRDLEGVRRAVLDAVQRIQGFGCAPGILGVCVGGDRATGFAVAKEQLLRPLDEKPTAFEKKLLKEANELGIGPMGLGGKTTLLGVKMAAMARLPASFFVTVAYMCWACRRRTVLIK